MGAPYPVHAGVTGSGQPATAGQGATATTATLWRSAPDRQAPDDGHRTALPRVVPPPEPVSGTAPHVPRPRGSVAPTEEGAHEPWPPTTTSPDATRRTTSARTASRSSRPAAPRRRR